MVKPPPEARYGQLEFVETAADSARLSRLARSARAWRLSPGVFAVGADQALPPGRLVRHHLAAIIGHFWPGAVLSGRSAWAGPTPVNGWVFVTHHDPERRADLTVADVTVAVERGPVALGGDIALPGDIYQPSDARGLVDNVSTRGRPAVVRPARRAGTEAVENRIDELARQGGAGAVRQALDQLDAIEGHFDARPVEQVRTRLRAVAGTLSGDLEPVSARLQARLAGTPYDQHTLDLLANVIRTLDRSAPPVRPALAPAERWQELPFFEAYFSNFIEGTVFGVEEARRIAVGGEEPVARPEDAHDVAATYRIAADSQWSSKVATSGEHLLDMLRDVHARLMAVRADVRPGQFKQLPNFAGGHQFLAPELVSGTLLRGWDQLAELTDAFSRAVALMFLLTECHPFDDGNGRVARLLVNGELSAGGQVRIVIPTAYRNDYLAALTAASNGAGSGEPLRTMLDFAHKWTAAVDWSSYDHAHADVLSSNAYEDPGAAERTGLRLRLPSHR